MALGFSRLQFRRNGDDTDRGYEKFDDEPYEIGIGSDNDNDERGNNNNNRKVIQVSSQIELPFSAEVAYEAYSDLPRQPSWSSWLESVVVLNDDDDENSNSNEPVVSKWTSKVLGIRYSWTAEAVQNERPHTIQWKSVTGLRNEGIVRFYKKEGNSYDQGPTLMTLKMSFVTPRAITSIIRRSKRLSKFVEEKMIAQSLTDFRDTIIETDLAKTGKELATKSATLR